jgi:hypothetical protein
MSDQVERIILLNHAIEIIKAYGNNPNSNLDNVPKDLQSIYNKIVELAEAESKCSDTK